MTTTPLAEADLLERLERHQAWLDSGAPEAEPFIANCLTVFDAPVGPCTLADAALVGVRFIRCTFTDARFERCDFSDAMLTDCDLRGATFLGCTFRKAELMGSDARNVDFSASSMTRADFSETDMRGADLSGCDLGWSWFTDTDLRDAVLEGVNLDGARLVRTRLHAVRRFSIGPLDRTSIKDVTLDAEAAGPALSGPEALDGIRTPP